MSHVCILLSKLTSHWIYWIVMCTRERDFCKSDKPVTAQDTPKPLILDVVLGRKTRGKYVEIWWKSLTLPAQATFKFEALHSSTGRTCFATLTCCHHCVHHFDWLLTGSLSSKHCLSHVNCVFPLVLITTLATSIALRRLRSDIAVVWARCERYRLYVRASTHDSCDTLHTQIHHIYSRKSISDQHE